MTVHVLLKIGQLQPVVVRLICLYKKNICVSLVRWRKPRSNAGESSVKEALWREEQAENDRFLDWLEKNLRGEVFDDYEDYVKSSGQLCGDVLQQPAIQPIEISSSLPFKMKQEESVTEY